MDDYFEFKGRIYSRSELQRRTSRVTEEIKKKYPPPFREEFMVMNKTNLRKKIVELELVIASILVKLNPEYL